MARRESASKNELLLQDNISGSELGLFYRAPTTKERQAYINKKSIVRGRKYIDNTVATRVSFGKRIITGLRDGDFERLGDEGGYQPIATENSSPNYFEGWKDWMEEHCDDVLTMLAIRVFESPITVSNSSVDDEEDEELDDLGK